MNWVWICASWSTRWGITMICNYVCYDEATWTSHDENDIIFIKATLFYFEMTPLRDWSQLLS
jgi:hypothetical protein